MKSHEFPSFILLNLSIQNLVPSHQRSKNNSSRLRLLMDLTGTRIRCLRTICTHMHCMHVHVEYLYVPSWHYHGTVDHLHLRDMIISLTQYHCAKSAGVMRVEYLPFKWHSFLYFPFAASPSIELFPLEKGLALKTIIPSGISDNEIRDSLYF